MGKKKVETKKADNGKMVGYCVKCKKKMEMKSFKVVVSKSGMNMAKGECIKCGCSMCKILGKA